MGRTGTGKSTLLHFLIHGKPPEEPLMPTLGLGIELLHVQDHHLIIWDLGGQETFRLDLWESVISDADGIVYVLQSITENLEVDELLLEEIVHNLDKLTSQKPPNVNAEIPVLIIINKQDLKELKINDVKPQFEPILAGRPHTYYTTIARDEQEQGRDGQNVNNAFRWIIDEILKRQDS